MKRYLLAAEADRIQDFIFQATHLREVVGGSQILTRFEDPTEGAAARLGIPAQDLVVSGGGSLRALFDSRDSAIQFGRQLAEVYQRATGSSLTVIDMPEEVDDSDDQDFRRAGRVVQERLRAAKNQRRGSLATPQLPYIAFCVSCGVELATRHTKRHDKEERAQYLCDTCLAKGAERAEESLGHFLRPFVQAVDGKGRDPDQYIWPGREKGRAAKKEIDPTMDVGQFDPRKYVAYLVADGNSMGKIFDQCSMTQMRRLSDEMTRVLQESLAEATRELRDRQPEITQSIANFVPALPLILAGDDLFALLPAPWALDMAKQFCFKFEENMTRLVDSLGLPQRAALPKRITIGASVVICKANYPFYLAYAVGNERLDQAKQLAKQLAHAPQGQMRSAVDFEIILGSQAGIKPARGEYRATLRPYWVTGSAPPKGWGVQLDALLNQRLELHSLPRKRLSQLRALYHPSVLPEKDTDLPRWLKQRDALFRRIGRDKDMLDQLRAAFTDLGGEAWYAVERTVHDDWHGHGIPDLLEAWDFAYRVDTPRRKYEEV